MDIFHADLQTTLHNAWFRKDHASPFKRDDFLAEARKAALPDTNWQAQRLALRGIFEGQRQRS